MLGDILGTECSITGAVVSKAENIPITPLLL
jgi:hypothetical protein